MGTVISSPTIKIGNTTYTPGSYGIPRGNIHILVNYTYTWSGQRYLEAHTSGYLFRDTTQVCKLFQDDYRDTSGEGIFPATLKESAHNELPRNDTGWFDVSGYGVFDRLKIVQSNVDTNDVVNDDGEWWFFFAYSTPGTPGNPRFDKQYAAAGEQTYFRWDASATGGNNAIQEYVVYKNGIELGRTTGTAYAITAPGTAGATDTYTVKALAVYGYKESAVSSGVTIYAISNPTAPRVVSVSNPSPNSGASITFTFSEAAAGTYNAITGYTLLQSTSIDGTYTEVSGATITTTDTGGQITINADNAGTKYYKIRTNGARTNSALSSAVAVTINNVPLQPVIYLGGRVSVSVDTTITSDVQKPWVRVHADDPDAGQLRTLYARSNGGSWQMVQSGTAGFDAAVQLTQAATYEFKVVDAAGAESPISVAITNAPTWEGFTDPQIIAGTTKVKAIHINELRALADALMEFYAGTTIDWSDTVVIGMSLKHFNGHIREIRSALSEIISAMADNGISVASPRWTAQLGLHPTADAINEARTKLLQI